ncbi:MAG TPA: hypothetical protein VER33_08625, partial [Polyangiaceae bacterium]|nr:hypothetical protein [Polyangiaceae bacterium]
MSASELLDDPALRLALPTERPMATLPRIAREVRARAGIHPVTDADGAAPELLAHALALAGAPHVVVVVADADAARRAVGDLSSLARGLPLSPELSMPSSPEQAPLLFAPAETTPYADVHADRRAGMLSAAALFHLARELPWRFAVITAATLVRRVSAPQVLREAGVFITAGDELDVQATARALVNAGYSRVPVVEDPGTFAVRGGLLDVWPANSEVPLRIELYGDQVQTLRSFDPEDQRTMGHLSSSWLAPAREAVIDAQAEA